MITAILKEGISHKTCKQCQYETTSIEDMTNHLNTHQLEELKEFKKKPIGGMKK